MAPNTGMFVLLVSIAVLVLPSGAKRHSADGMHTGTSHELGTSGVPNLDDPFGDLMADEPLNPNINSAVNPTQRRQAAQEERLLTSEALLDEQVELREDEQMEVLCHMSHGRESSGYDVEQAQEVREEAGKDLRNWVPTDAEHKCLPLAQRNKFIPGRLLGLSRKVAVPAFPERLGELVIEEVTHTDKTNAKKHVVLDVAGCSSCENDLTQTVEWLGLLPLDETGKPTGMKSKKSSDATEMLVQGTVDRSTYPRKFSFSKAASGAQKYAKRFRYKYSSYHFDTAVEPEAKKLATTAVEQNELVDAEFLKEHEEDALELMEHLKAQTTHIPFNHKMEQLHMNIKLCDEKSAFSGYPYLKCGDVQETLIVHDGGFVMASAKTALFDELGRSAGHCTYGPCRKKTGIQVGNQLFPYAMCTGCGRERCPSSRAEPDKNAPTLMHGAEENWFNCMAERVHKSNGEYEDLLLQPPDDNSNGARKGYGMLYHGTQSPGHVQGHINWHVSIPPKGHCEPVLQDALYVGIGVDECDRCQTSAGEAGGVDVDIGAIMIKCSQSSDSDKLGNAERGGCQYYDHLNYARKTGKQNFYGISDDNRGGEGEGDDEWIFLDLKRLKAEGVTHVVLIANVFGCAPGSGIKDRRGPIKWEDLEGAFMRVTASGLSEKALKAAETISYVDLDELRGGADDGAAVYMLYLSDNSKLAVPEQVMSLENRKDAAANDGKAWKLLSMKMGFPGNTVQKSIPQLAKLLYGGVIERKHENTIEEQDADMDLLTSLSTGQEMRAYDPEAQNIMEADWSADLREVVNDGIHRDLAQPQPNEDAFEKSAREISEEYFFSHFSESLPEGAPGTDAHCMK